MVLAYDVTDEKTFSNIEEWMNCIAENTQEYQIIQKVILANKTDLDPDLHRVLPEDGRTLASKHGIDFFEVSAKDGTGIHEAFLHLSQLVLKVSVSPNLIYSHAHYMYINCKLSQFTILIGTISNYKKNFHLIQW